MESYDVINSDDMDFGEAPSKIAANCGQKSIERIFEEADVDRFASKRVVKHLAFGEGAPSTRITQSLWVRRFEAFRTRALKQDIDRPFTGDDLIRFFSSILNKLVLPTGKPAPNKSTIVTAVQILVAYGHFRWDEAAGFKMDRHAGIRFSTWMDDALKAGQLMRGEWKKNTWIGFPALSRLVRAHFTHAIDAGTTSWDVTIAKGLSVVLVASLNARVGDVGRAAGYPCSMQYRHITITLEGDRPVLANLRAAITMQFLKGHKDEFNHDPVRHISPLNDHNHSHMCPIALLLVHSLRHSLVAGTTLQEVLDRAFARSDRKIVWLFPERPVLAQFAKHGTNVLLDESASASQVTATIREMAVISGMIDRAYGHALRLGAARDIAHLPSTVMDGAGMDAEKVRRALGHTHRAQTSGVTEEYVGESTVEFWNARARHPKVNRREPRFAAPEEDQPIEIVKAPVSKAEIEQVNSLRSKPASSTYAATIVRRDRLQSLGETVEAGHHKEIMKLLQDPSPLPPTAVVLQRPPLAAKDVNAPLASARRLTVCNLDETGQQGQPLITSHPGSDSELYRNIDPAMLTSEELAMLAESLPVAVTEDLEAILQGRDPGHAEVFSEAYDVRLDQLDATDDQAALLAAADADVVESAAQFLGDDGDTPGPEKWILAYAKYNMVKNASFAQYWSTHAFGAEIPQDYEWDSALLAIAASGGSRDQPQPFPISCPTPGCQYQSFTQAYVSKHLQSCTQTRVEQFAAEVALAVDQYDFACKFPDCEYVPAPLTKDPKLALKNHVDTAHGFQPKPCEYGCDPTKLYDTGSGYRYHLHTKHSGRWPARCIVPGCIHTGQFAALPPLKEHLLRHHQLEGAATVPFLPPLPAQRA